MKNLYEQLADKLIGIVQQAGRAEMQVLERGVEVDLKGDESPVTQADRIAEKIILDSLAEIAPDIPVVAEEAASLGQIPQIADRFFLVDPLDGTKEFIRKSNEFTVNIALIQDGDAVFGIVYAPALHIVYFTLGPTQAFMAKLDPYGTPENLATLKRQSISTRIPPDDGLSVVASKSHMTDKTRSFIDKFDVTDQKSAGSSLKFCLLATGEADLYPRFGPTMEWDTAAGHAVLKAAGGEVRTETGEPLTYGKSGDNFYNPFFIASSGKLMRSPV